MKLEALDERAHFVTLPDTMSDREAADRLGFPLRSIRAVIDREGLCLRVGRRRRLTEVQFRALIAALTPAPLCASTNRGLARRVSDVRSADAMARALALVAAAKRTKSGRRP